MATDQAVLTDVQQRMLRPLTQPETVWVQTALHDAFRIILISIPDVGTQLDSSTLPPDAPYRALVVQVECAMVIRVLQNPDGVLEETTDDYTRRLDAARSTGALYMTDGERALLTAGIGGAEGAFSVRAVPNAGWDANWFPTTTTDTWVPNSLSGPRW